MKKIIIISDWVVGLLIIGVAGYYIWNLWGSLNGVLPPTSPIASTTPTIAPDVSTKPIKAVSESQVLTYNLQADKITIAKTDGTIVTIAVGKEYIISSSPMLSLMNAKFSSDNKKILAEFGTRNTSEFSMFDFGTLIWTELGPRIMAADWSPATHEIAYLEKLPLGSNLGIINTNKFQNDKKPELGFAKTVLGVINELDSNITWLSKNEIILSPKPTRAVPSTLLKYKIKEKTFSTIVNNALGAVIGWDKYSGLGVEFSVVNNKDNLMVIDSSGAVRAQMGFVTMPEKCKIWSNYLYCAIPNAFGRSNLPDSYHMRTLFFRDNFYRINLTDGRTELVLSDTGGIYDAKHLQVSNDKIYFINNLDGKLYQFTMTVK